MILVDSRVGSKELLPTILKLGVPAQLDQLEAGDFAFYGNTSDGQILIGMERKRLDSSDDILASIHTGRYAGFQQHNMIAMYPIRILVVEGIWKCSPEGSLLVRDWQGWREITNKGKPTPYSSLYCWLLSVTFTAGTYWMQTQSPFETAFRVVQTYRWFNKPWEAHMSQGAIHTPATPQFAPPSLKQRVAAQFSGVGVKRSLTVAKHFENIPDMIEASEKEWASVEGIGPKTAKTIYREIRGVAPLPS